MSFLLLEYCFDILIVCYHGNVYNGPIRIQDDGRKREAVSLGVDSTSYESVEEVNCAENEALENGKCGKCLNSRASMALNENSTKVALSDKNGNV